MRPFNWKKYPADVYYFVVPLATIGFSIMATIAYIQWDKFHDYWYAVICGVGFTVLLSFILMMIRANNRMKG